MIARGVRRRQPSIALSFFRCLRSPPPALRATRQAQNRMLLLLAPATSLCHDRKLCGPTHDAIVSALAMSRARQRVMCRVSCVGARASRSSGARAWRVARQPTRLEPVEHRRDGAVHFRLDLALEEHAVEAILRGLQRQPAGGYGIEDRGRVARGELVVVAQTQREQQLALPLQQPLLMVRLRLPKALKRLERRAGARARGQRGLRGRALRVVVRKYDGGVLARSSVRDEVVRSEEGLDDRGIRND